jgi:hypothetical protein
MAMVKLTSRMQSIDGRRKKGSSTFVSASNKGMSSLSSSTTGGMASARSKLSLADSIDVSAPATCLPPHTPGKRKLSFAALNTPSAPNGAPLIETTAEPAAKRKRMSPGPNALGSLRDAGRSLVHLLGEGAKGGVTPGKRRRRSSLSTGEWLVACMPRSV